MDINILEVLKCRKAYGLQVLDTKSWFQDLHVSPEAKTSSNFPQKIKTMLKGYRITYAKFQEIL